MAASSRKERLSFPRLSARTRRFTLGEPRTFTPSAGSDSVLFLRSCGPTDPITCLWTFDLASGTERRLVDPAELLSGELDDLPEAEARRRERARESASGIVAYSTDRATRLACYALGGQVFVTDVRSGDTKSLDSAPGAFDPRLDPTGAHVAYVSGLTLRLTSLQGGDRLLAGEDDPEVSWGSAEFVAAEEMGRSRGFWWSPDGNRVAVARVDVAEVATWYLTDAANPAEPQVALRYPSAGTANADVSLAVVDLHGHMVRVIWDNKTFPYLANVDWSFGSPLTLVVQSRDQRTLVVLEADPDTGATRQVWSQNDEHWVELVPGAPRWLDGRLLVVVDRDGARRVVIDGVAVTPPDLQVRAVVGTVDGDLVVTASPDPSETHVYRLGLDAQSYPERLTTEPGVHNAIASGSVLVISSATMTRAGQRVAVWRNDHLLGEIASLAAKPGVTPKGRFHILGSRKLRSVVLLPRVVEGPLPVLVDPYGGPHAQRVVRSRNAHLSSQWFADQGFAVVVTDGRGTPARGPEWERAVWGDLAQPVLDDQVDALEALGARDERLDLSRVGIRGWSFGGYLAALAVLRRPDVFHAAIAGAPVTDWQLYDTHYTERYLGHPAECPENYERTSLILEASRLTRPLLLIHGLADDNVVSAHTFRLSAALLAHGRTHQVLPLAGVTHMTPQEAVAENLLLFQVAFLHQALGLSTAQSDRE